MLTVLNLIAAKKINREFIEPGPELTETYTNHWQRLMEDGSIADLARPFYDMNVEPFWELAPRHGVTLPGGEIYTMEKLQKFYLGARIDHELFKLSLMEPLRRKLQNTLISTYFDQERRRGQIYFI